MDKIRYRLKINVSTGYAAWLLKFVPNALTFVAYDISATVLSNVGVANAVLAPFGVAIEIQPS